jgi:hypothetical protein
MPAGGQRLTFDLPLAAGTHAPTGSASACPSGGLFLSAGGTFDGATLTVEQQTFTVNEEVEPLPVDGCELTAVGSCSLYVGAGEITVVVTGGTAPQIKVVGQCGLGVIAQAIGGAGGGVGFASVVSEFRGETGAVENVLLFDIDEDGGRDYEFFGSGLTARFRPVGDAPLFYRHFGIGTGNGGFNVQINSPSQSNAGVQVGKALMSSVNASSTHPSLIPTFDDNNTGIGRDSGGGLSLIDDATLIALLDTAGLHITDGLKLHMPTASTLPTPAVAGDCGYDAEQGLCCYDGANYVQVSDNSTVCIT